MATPTSQRVSIIIILVIFSIVGVGGTVMSVLGSKQSDSSTKKVSQTKLEGNSMQDFTPVPKVDKLDIKDLKVGTGDEVKPTDTVTVHYTGANASTGIVFQSSKDSGQPVSFPLNGVIKGWTDGVPGMKVGGTRRLLIPADLAYGANPPQGSNIPANADLVFDIELISIADPSAQQPANN
jgi:FKBP-type peptidyl-prolyl cis-trans isomerase